MIPLRTIGRIVEKIEVAERETLGQLSAGEIETEPSLTDRFAAEIKRAFGQDHGLEVGQVRVFVRTLGAYGPGAPEREFGADLCVVLDVNIPQYRVSKGFLVQSKRVGSREVPAARNQARNPRAIKFGAFGPGSKFREQCSSMLRVTHESYVWVYSPNGITIVPALKVPNVAPTVRTARLNCKGVAEFFEDFLKTFVGDPKLIAHDDATLRQLREETQAGAAMLLQINRAKFVGTKQPVIR